MFAARLVLSSFSLPPPIQSQFSSVLLRSALSRSFHFLNEHLASVQLSSHLLILVRLSTAQFTSVQLVLRILDGQHPPVRSLQISKA